MKLTLVTIILLLSIQIFKAQSTVRTAKFGGGLQLVSSGNGHGAFYQPFVSLNYGPNSFLFGAMIHKQTGTTRGCKITYSRNLSGQVQYESGEKRKQELDLLQLNFFSYIQYTDQVSLCSSVVRTERSIRREYNIDWTNVKLNTIEGGAGIEFRINISRVFCIRNTIGAGVYNHLTYIKGMDHEKIAPTLNLSTGININLQ